MPHSLRSRLALSTALVLAAPMALADVTTADVWQNANAPMQAMGFTVSATETVSGDTTSYTDISYDFTLPMNAGGGSFVMSGLDLTDNGDGTVTMDYADDFTMALSAFIAGEGSFSADLEMTGYEANSIIASGEPGNVTYVGEVGAVTMTMGLRNVMVDNAAVDDLQFDLTFTTTGSTTTQQIIEGDLVEWTLQATSGAGTTQLSLTDPLGNTTEVTGAQEDNAFALALMLPAGGSDLMNLAPALAQGLSIAAAFQSDGSEQVQTVTNDLGAQISSQKTRQGANEVTLAFDEDGLIVAGTSASIDIELQDQFIPFPIAVSAGASDARYEFPVTATEAAQPFSFALNLAQFAISDDLWNLMDPGQQLDRSAADLRINLSGEAILREDLLNFMALAQSAETGTIPATVTQFSIDEVQFGALGAVVQAAGAVALNSDEFFTGFGMPTIVGDLNFSLDGVNQAMDQLVGAGLLSPDDIFGARMMMGMVAVPSGDDSLAGEIVFGEDGSISANGQRLR